MTRKAGVDKDGIRSSAAEHVARYLATNGEDGYYIDKWATLLLTTTGRLSGEPRIAPLIFGMDEDRYIVVASFGGSKTYPAWYTNLQADPKVTLQIKADHLEADARTATGEERRRLWDMMVAIFPHYASYEKKAGRQIPIIVLDPTGGSPPPMGACGPDRP